MNIEKIVRIGTMEVYNGKYASIYCKIEYKDKNGQPGKKCLSISGVIGPARNGNALGGCGQIDMEFWHENPEHNDSRYTNLVKPEDIDFAESWNRFKWLHFLKIWKLYHLNDMNAGCAHQRALNWGNKELEIVTYGLTDTISNQQNHAKRITQVMLRETGKAEITEIEKEILSLEWEIKKPAEYKDDYLNKYYKEKSRETKRANWVYEKDHPEGVLCKPCPECGYKYGSAWKYSRVPKIEIDFLYNLPNADREPAWC